AAFRAVVFRILCLAQATNGRPRLCAPESPPVAVAVADNICVERLPGRERRSCFQDGQPSQSRAAHESGLRQRAKDLARSCGYCGGTRAPAGRGPAMAELLERPRRAASRVEAARTV